MNLLGACIGMTDGDVHPLPRRVPYQRDGGIGMRRQRQHPDQPTARRLPAFELGDIGVADMGSRMGATRAIMD